MTSKLCIDQVAKGQLPDVNHEIVYLFDHCLSRRLGWNSKSIDSAIVGLHSAAMLVDIFREYIPTAAKDDYILDLSFIGNSAQAGNQ